MVAALAPGLADAVLDSQRIFRGVLSAMAAPGTPVTLQAALPPLPGVHPAALGFLLALADLETPVWLSPGVASPDLASYLRFHCGAPVVAETSAAAFALVAGAGDLPPLDRFAIGAEEYPESATSLLIQLDALEGGPARRIKGPGLAQPASVAPMGLDQAFWSQFQRNRALYPLGVDVFLSAGNRLMALPRSLIVED
ncbi:MAG TPA: phosphonate C-P lyase system protein PhnH [Reyranella sp.]|jgi:alpha-D-ribose 1-methylphosphonate 5-triphosphate synthase subunit PhnH|nr:phosphonate C-P lyase system protein PhnH [Reyranella sp.]